MIKPDGVQRQLIGAIISRLETVGLKIVAMNMAMADKDKVKGHYPMEDMEWIVRLGNKGLNTMTELSLDAKEMFGTDDAAVIGREVADSLVEYMTSGPVVIMVVEGIQAVDMVRKIVGHTLPFKADIGSIRGMYSVDSPAVANVEKRSIQNLIHASETVEEALKEIKHWFGEDYAIDYKFAAEDIMYSKTY
jgi:nucleoside-diphosphate kinase